MVPIGLQVGHQASSGASETDKSTKFVMIYVLKCSSFDPRLFDTCCIRAGAIRCVEDS